ncbi:MAG: hypothetical protein R3B06_10755 [Kofleriaceae bacterium]
MRLTVLLYALATASGCATTLPIYGMGQRYRAEDEAGASAKPVSKFRACAAGYWLAGLGVDAALIAADLGLGETLDGVDALVVTPLVLDVFVSTVVAVPCLLGD